MKQLRDDLLKLDATVQLAMAICDKADVHGETAARDAVADVMAALGRLLRQ